MPSGIEQPRALWTILYIWGGTSAAVITHTRSTHGFLRVSWRAAMTLSLRTAPAPWLRRPGLPLLTSRKKEEPARVVLLCSQAALWRCSSVLQSSPPTECSGGAVSIADIALNSLGSPTERPGTPPRPPANTSLFPVSGPACLDVTWPWSHGGCDLLCLVSVTHRHALQVHPGRVVSGLPSSLSLSDTPLGAGVDFTCPVCPWALSVRVLAARGVGA